VDQLRDSNRARRSTQACSDLSAESRRTKPLKRLVSDGRFSQICVMNFLAATAAPTALEKLKQIPPAFWLKVGIAVVALILIVVILKKLAGANKVIMAVVILLAVSIIGFNWIYERNEPTWATPVVEKLATFFPAKDSYNTTQKKPLKNQ
jgi:hypothetical protein